MATLGGQHIGHLRLEVAEPPPGLAPDEASPGLVPALLERIRLTEESTNVVVSAIRRHQTLVNCGFSFCWETTITLARLDGAAGPFWPGTLRFDVS
ncbi:hypothetical protein [Actinoplanes auranticolor]|uniref:Uncharacterized protein n=1 Tax=Actinoplanes auranticolor TaxID=47988 RepID=A0A919SVF4_9ACTN|nr:hypothetical protein [Actinoplanes auranticolor]GIM79605.1 hypothetical protein Aau02nite_86570 [Actinoplanes auranticolor]